MRVSYAGSTVTDASDAENALVAFDYQVTINGYNGWIIVSRASLVGTDLNIELLGIIAFHADTLTNSLFTVQYSTDGGSTWITQSHT